MRAFAEIKNNKQIDIIDCGSLLVGYITIGKRRLSFIAGKGNNWEHVSVSLVNKSLRFPTWNEMCAVKDAFFYEDEEVVQIHPRKKEFVSLNESCLHLWRNPNISQYLSEVSK